jgi:hypothetical protein
VAVTWRSALRLLDPGGRGADLPDDVPALPDDGANAPAGGPVALAPGPATGAAPGPGP